MGATSIRTWKLEGTANITVIEPPMPPSVDQPRAAQLIAGPVAVTLLRSPAAQTVRVRAIIYDQFNRPYDLNPTVT